MTNNEKSAKYGASWRLAGWSYGPGPYVCTLRYEHGPELEVRRSWFEANFLDAMRLGRSAAAIASEEYTRTTYGRFSGWSRLQESSYSVRVDFEDGKSFIAPTRLLEDHFDEVTASTSATFPDLLAKAGTSPKAAKTIELHPVDPEDPDGGCWARFPDGMTVRAFIPAMLREYPDRRGSVGVIPPEPVRDADGSAGDPWVMYHDGTPDTMFADAVLDRTVVHAVAAENPAGGGGRLDWMLFLDWPAGETDK